MLKKFLEYSRACLSDIPIQHAVDANKLYLEFFWA